MIGSNTEQFLKSRVAPLLISKRGKQMICALYAVILSTVIYGCLKIEQKSSLVQLYHDDMFIIDYMETSQKYFTYELDYIISYTESPDLDFASEQVQVQMHVFNEAYARCEGCRRRWHVPNTLDSWYYALRDWIEEGRCPHLEEDERFDPFTKTIKPGKLRRCLVYFVMNDDTGAAYKEMLFPKFEEEP